MSTTSSLELAVLGLLKEGAMHGYELSKRLRFTLGPLYTVSYGSLYPCLKRLGAAGMVRERHDETDDAKPKRLRTRRTASEAGPIATTRGTTRRARKVYEITAEGETFFFQQLEQGAVYDTDRFQTRFAFFRYLPNEMRIRLLEHRKAYLEEKLAEFDETLRATRERMDAYSRSLIDHSVETTQTDIRWLQGLIDEERRATRDSAAPSGTRKQRRAAAPVLKKRPRAATGERRVKRGGQS
jgi:DNA-binding PadR family transcriptional regulator